MKKTYIGLIIIVIIVLFYYIFSPGETNGQMKDDSIREVSGSNEVDDSSLKNINLHKYYPPKKSNVVVDYGKMSLEEIKKYRVDNPSGVIISSLELTDLPEEDKDFIRKRFENLKEYGSFNKNKLTNEFKNVDKYRKYIDVDRPLSFKPTKNEYLENNFDLTGKYFSGTYSKEEGHDSYTRLYENEQTGQKVEIVETYLNPSNNSISQRFIESFNKNINGVGITWQEVSIGDKVFYSADFSTNQKKISLSTLQVDKANAEQLVSSLIQSINNP